MNCFWHEQMFEWWCHLHRKRISYWGKNQSLYKGAYTLVRERYWNIYNKLGFYDLLNLRLTAKLKNILWSCFYQKCMLLHIHTHLYRQVCVLAHKTHTYMFQQLYRKSSGRIKYQTVSLRGNKSTMYGEWDWRKGQATFTFHFIHVLQ